ncbi:hypothetical protein [Nocardioides acrostichi]|uniref:VTT domain-containing protein n=1 Tax=Nocardioides acrostichi TaxID=2784339 RepID=A0A930Y4V3_9ACTN|nr:hypothetical protein [Nocardioides acrostichi]MBF4160595.1 hypothetical protein [Nocardioides acrostichi]
MSWALGILAGVGYGLGSALLPIVNAEAYAVVCASTRAWVLVPVVIALAAGQTVGKLLLFEAARRGSTRFHTGSKVAALAESRWAIRIRSALVHRRTALPLMLASAGLGLPPLALVSVAAGASGQPRRTFAGLCLLGRTARFAAIAIPVAYATGIR